MAISSSPRGLTYTPSHPALTWDELHDELILLADRELSLEAVDSILRLCAEDGELLSVTVRCHLARPQRRRAQSRPQDRAASRCLQRRVWP